MTRLPRKPVLLSYMALVIALGLAADLGWRAVTRPRYAVAVEGRIIGAVRTPGMADAALAAVMAQITPEMEVHAKLPEKLNVRTLDGKERLTGLSIDDIQTALIKTIPSLTRATAITVNNRDVVAVADAKTAQAVKESILEEYRASVLRDATVEQLKFQENIAWRPKLVKTENVRTTDEAINILKLGTDKLVKYVVKSGDTGWDIARSYSVSTEQLAKANPNADMENLRIGQELNVTFREPYVHTQSVSKRIVKEAIPFAEQVSKDPNLWPWQHQVVTPGVPGVRQLTVRDYREDGRVVKSDLVENVVVSEPKPQIAKTGTKQVPSMGTGSLVYPVVGVLTSSFGPRWGSFHEGIDIAAPTGTAVLAADSGMVVFTGWSGNYGYLLKIDHGGGRMETWYGHLSRFAVDVGDAVRKGQVVGYVGNTGFSTGPHLHYEVRRDGAATDPLGYYQ